MRYRIIRIVPMSGAPYGAPCICPREGDWRARVASLHFPPGVLTEALEQAAFGIRLGFVST
jgi:hypothetical protein